MHQKEESYKTTIKQKTAIKITTWLIRGRRAWRCFQRFLQFQRDEHETMTNVSNNQHWIGCRSLRPHSSVLSTKAELMGENSIKKFFLWFFPFDSRKKNWMAKHLKAKNHFGNIKKDPERSLMNIQFHESFLPWKLVYFLFRTFNRILGWKRVQMNGLKSLLIL